MIMNREQLEKHMEGRYVKRDLKYRAFKKLFELYVERFNGDEASAQYYLERDLWVMAKTADDVDYVDRFCTELLLTIKTKEGKLLEL